MSSTFLASLRRAEFFQKYTQQLNVEFIVKNAPAHKRKMKKI